MINAYVTTNENTNGHFFFEFLLLLQLLGKSWADSEPDRTTIGTAYKYAHWSYTRSERKPYVTYAYVKKEIDFCVIGKINFSSTWEFILRKFSKDYTPIVTIRKRNFYQILRSS